MECAIGQGMDRAQQDSELYFYCDGHVRVYHGNQTALPRHYVARERLCCGDDRLLDQCDGWPAISLHQ